MASLDQRLRSARRAGRRLAGAVDRRKVALAAFVEELAPERRPSAFPDARAVATFEDPLGEITARHAGSEGFERVDVRVPAGLVLGGPSAGPELVAASLAAGDAIALPDGGFVAEARRALEEAGLEAEAVVEIEASELEQAAVRADVVVGDAGEAAGASSDGRAGGLCHTYVDGAADLGEAVDVCRAGLGEGPTSTGTVLVHEAVAEGVLPPLREAAGETGVELAAGEAARRRIPGTPAASKATWDTPGGPLGVRVVGSLEEALEHVNAHGGTVEAIATREAEAAVAFLEDVEAPHAVVNGPTTLGEPTDRRVRRVEAGDVDVEALTSTRHVHLPDADQAEDGLDQLAELVGERLAGRR